MNWVIILVALLVLTLVWHNVLFGTQYPGHLSGIVVKDANGDPAPRMAYFILAHMIIAFLFSYYLPAVARSRKAFALHGLAMGIMSFGFFAILSHALFQNWTLWLMGMDVAFGTLSGLITGYLVSFLAGNRAT